VTKKSGETAVRSKGGVYWKERAGHQMAETKGKESRSKVCWRTGRWEKRGARFPKGEVKSDEKSTHGRRSPHTARGRDAVTSGDRREEGMNGGGGEGQGEGRSEGKVELGVTDKALRWNHLLR